MCREVGPDHRAEEERKKQITQAGEPGPEAGCHILMPTGCPQNPQHSVHGSTCVNDFAGNESMDACWKREKEYNTYSDKALFRHKAPGMDILMDRQTANKWDVLRPVSLQSAPVFLKVINSVSDFLPVRVYFGTAPLILCS